MIDKTPFDISFPIEVLERSRILNFEDQEIREEVLKRNIYYCLYGEEKNPLLIRRSGIYYSLSQKVLNLIKRNHPSLDVMNISVFGSALFSKNPADFDFLAIVEGNVFLLEETKLDLEEILFGEDRRLGRYSVGISIKGLDNFVKGVCDTSSQVPSNYQKQIIYRTASALFRRHIPILGYDFINNKEVFLHNIYAQASDLLNNTYELYYLDNEKKKLNNEQRAKKICSRIYEAVSYLEFLGNDNEITELRKGIYFSMENGFSFSESKKLFDKVIVVYENRIKQKRSKNE